jgi:hypothetical protein
VLVDQKTSKSSFYTRKLVQKKLRNLVPKKSHQAAAKRKDVINSMSDSKIATTTAETKKNQHKLGMRVCEPTCTSN